MPNTLEVARTDNWNKNKTSKQIVEEREHTHTNTNALFRVSAWLLVDG